MGGPYGTKRRSTSDVAGRYLAAIGGGSCGELEDPSLLVETCGGLARAKGHDGSSSLTITVVTNLAKAPGPATVAPKTPTKSGSRRPPLLHSPSQATAWGKSASPYSRKSRSTPSRSPVSYGTRASRTTKNKSSNFFRILPSTKSAVGISSDSSNNKQHEATVAAKQSPPLPPPPLLRHSGAEASGVSSTAEKKKPTDPQHIQQSSLDPYINFVQQSLKTALEEQPRSELHSRPTQASGMELRLGFWPPSSPARVSSSSPVHYVFSETSDGMSDLFSAAGAPTEIMTNRTSGRRYAMNREEAPWRDKKSIAGHIHTFVDNTLYHHTNKADQMHREDLAEEKKQDSDIDDRTQEQPRGVGLQQESSHGKASPIQSEDDILLFGPVPLERSSTRRTSNRGNFNRPNPASPMLAHRQVARPYGHYLMQAQTLVHQPPSSLPECHNRNYTDHIRNDRRLTPNISNNGHINNPKSFVKQNGDTTVDVKSLLSASTNDDSSSAMSQTSLLNASLRRANASVAARGSQGNQLNNKHWWSAENVKIQYRMSPIPRQQGNILQQLKRRIEAKPIVAYPDSPPAYLKQQSDPTKDTRKLYGSRLDQTSNGEVHKTVDASFGSQKTDGGILGQGNQMDHVDDDDAGHPHKPVETIAAEREDKNVAIIPKLAPSKQDQPKASSPQEGWFQHHRQQQQKGAASHERQEYQPSVELKRRKAYVSASLAADTDPGQSVVSESSCWTPVLVSEDGLNFSTDKGAPLLPLFSQDRFDFHDESTNPKQRVTNGKDNNVHMPAIRLEPKRCSEPDSTRDKEDPSNNPQNEDKQGEPRCIPSVPAGAQGSGPGSRPCSPPVEIWRRGEIDEINSMTSPVPIFCSRPFILHAHSTMISSVESLSTAQSTPPRSQNGSTQTLKNRIRLAEVMGQCPSRQHSPNQWTTRDASERRKSQILHPRPVATRGVKPASDLLTVDAASHDIPRRSKSGPCERLLRSRQNSPEEELVDNCEISSTQIETSFPAGEGVVYGPSGSFPQRSRSERTGEKVNRVSTPPQISFQTAFAAFERASSPRKTSCYAAFKKEDGSVEPKLSRLSMVLDAHLAQEAHKTTGIQKSEKADLFGVDIHSIRSNYEAADGIEDDDDDTASVKSLREVFEAPATELSSSDNAVSRMRALFESQKKPTAKNFETQNAELQLAWNKFARDRRRVFSKDTKQSATGHSVSVEDRARLLGRKQNDAEDKLMVLRESAHQFEMVENGCRTTVVSKAQTQDVPNSSDKNEKHDATVDISIDDIEDDIAKPRNDCYDEAVGLDDSFKSALEPTSPSDSRKAGRKGMVVAPRRIPRISYVDGSGDKAASDSPPHHDAWQRDSGSATEILIPSDRIVNLKNSEEFKAASKPESTANSQVTPTRSAGWPEKIVSPPRPGMQSNPRDFHLGNRNNYLPKDFTPTSKTSKQKPHDLYHNRDTFVAASESEFSDGVTLDLSIADVSQLTCPTAIQSKTDDDSTLGDVSTGVKTLETHLVDCDAKRSEASSSQQTEAAVPLMGGALKRLSDDLSLESSTPETQFGEKAAVPSGAIASDSFSEEHPKEPEQKDLSGWDVGRIETLFPIDDSVYTPDEFFRFDEESKEEWQVFEEYPFLSPNPILTLNQNEEAKTPQIASYVQHGFHLDERRDGSIHISEASCPRQSDSKTLAQNLRSPQNLQRKTLPSPSLSNASQSKGDSRSKTASPVRSYDTRSHLYTQAKMHAKSMLAARSPMRNKRLQSGHSTPPRANACQSMRHISPGCLYRKTNVPSQFGDTSARTTPSSTTSPSISPVRGSLLSFRSSTHTPLHKSHTPASRFINTTRTQLPVTPAKDISTREALHVTPKTSHRTRDAPLKFPVDPVDLSFSDLWMPTGKHVASSINGDSFSSPPTARVHLSRSGQHMSQPAPDSNTCVPRPPTIQVDPNNYLFQHLCDDSVSHSVNRFTEHPRDDFSLHPDDFFSALPPKALDRDLPTHSSHAFPRGMFSRTHPTSSQYRQQGQNASTGIKHAHHNAPTSHVQALHGRAPPVPRNPSPQRRNFPEQPLKTRCQPTSGGLSAIVGKHAALVARLRDLKAARLRRSIELSSDEGYYERDDSHSTYSISRAIASVYRFRRPPPTNSRHNAIHSRHGKGGASILSDMTDGPGAGMAVDAAMNVKAMYFRKAQTFHPPKEAFDPFQGMGEMDACSESTSSSTRFGGKAFAATLEVE